MDLQLKGKSALITGSTGGIGYATAKILLEEGAIVTINGRTQESVSQAVEKLKSEVPNASVDGFVTDFSQASQVYALLERHPQTDILINNVGIYKSQTLYDTRDEDWQEQFEVNVMSGVRLSRHYLPKMLERNWGRILFVSSECASIVPPDLIAYGMTKTAILAVSRGLAQLTSGSHVTVNAVLPGSTLSEGAKLFLKGVAKEEGKTEQEVEKAFFTNVRTSSLLQRFASVAEVANTMTYLVSPLSAATNGAAIKIDGGSIGGII